MPALKPVTPEARRVAKKRAGPRVRLDFRVPLPVRERLERAHAETGRSLTQLVIEAVEAQYPEGAA